MEEYYYIPYTGGGARQRNWGLLDAYVLRASPLHLGSTFGRLLFFPFSPPPPDSGEKKALRYSPIPLLEAGREGLERGFSFFRWNGIDLRGWGERGGDGDSEEIYGSIDWWSLTPLLYLLYYIVYTHTVLYGLYFCGGTIQCTVHRGGWMCIDNLLLTFVKSGGGRHFGHTCKSEFLWELFHVRSFFARFATLS